MPARRPLALSDSELDIVLAAAKPLAVPDQTPFLEAVAEAVALMRERGDGALFRICRDLQRQWLTPPELEELRVGTGGGRHPGKYGRA